MKTFFIVAVIIISIITISLLYIKYNIPLYDTIALTSSILFIVSAIYFIRNNYEQETIPSPQDIAMLFIMIISIIITISYSWYKPLKLIDKNIC